ncbi:MAG: phenylalanine--tRNA ligase subunit beta [Chloroflexi bacterium AL-W]|nr:phenylalanine--tRNA ligase subunit beta [Chloroflexi bacterium AL-N1]NOK68611.1 phenylalanine--tRNA ligase subunit beta [Chloroflexi bacterium AL-N10]NOK76097.1 phenylalanine--tRNA ligase subunit beta [Chloroflexi bacterium AL-N5]NOK82570.1 phenylalanine--tRNA ligase subunit beta [Chloroflexi bacterium AL-W]NOK93368.1 phenylalanine--tRNA ligase subunit beta [Chloroflexi bacterium AL-N15]
MMRVPISWLKEFVDVTVSVEELAHIITMAGLEVESIDYIGLGKAELPWDPELVFVGNILEVRQHPDADRLVLADVDYGAGAPHTVVTGAPNLFPYKDQGRLSHPLKGVFAKEGSVLYDGHADGKVKMKLKGRSVRGVMSNAMLCSEKELDLSEEHEGILILPDDAPTGMPLRDYLGDVVLDIAITPNVARALSILGVAREVAAITNTPLRMPEFTLEATGPSIEGRAQVTIETPDLCPRFTATLIEGITIGSSPFWMQRRLLMAGMRPINNIVDVTNYVMLELGQPSHAFNADAVTEQHLIVRSATSGERLTTLDGKEHQLTPERLLVCDPKGALSLAGVMGGATSEVSDTTTRVLLEAATWEPTTIRKTARELKLPSEASRRFERGVDYELPPLMQRRALGLMQEIAGGTVAEGIVDAYPRPWQKIVLDLPPSEITRIVGVTLSAEEIAALLERLEFICELVKIPEAETVVRATAPSYRLDVTNLADLCEEVARIYGYDQIPETRLADELPEPLENSSLVREQRVRDILARCGLDEAMTYSMTNMTSVARVNPDDAEPTLHMRVENPITPEREYLRRSLLPVLLESFAQNLRERERVLVFEIGRVYLPHEGQVRPDEPRRLAITMAGPRDTMSWFRQNHAGMDFFDLKGVVETLLSRLNITKNIAFEPLTDDKRFHPGRAASLVHSGKDASQVLGVLGELHPDLRERLDLETPRALVAELDLEALIELAQPVQFHSISRYPATVQDLAVVVGIDVPAQRVADAIRKYAGVGLESLTLFDIYEGPQVGEGKRSLAYRLAFRAMDRTLSDTEVNKSRTKIVRGLERDVGGTIRA